MKRPFADRPPDGRTGKLEKKAVADFSGLHSPGVYVKLKKTFEYLEEKTGGTVALVKCGKELSSRFPPEGNSLNPYVWRLCLSFDGKNKEEEEEKRKNWTLTHGSLTSSAVSFVTGLLDSWLDVAVDRDVDFYPMSEWNEEVWRRLSTYIYGINLSDFSRRTHFKICEFDGRSFEECVLEIDMRLPDVDWREKEKGLSLC